MRNAPNASPDAIDPATLWGTIAKSLPGLMVWTLAILGITFGLLTLIAPRYQSEAQLTIDAKTATNPFSDPKQVSSGPDSTDRKSVV